MFEIETAAGLNLDAVFEPRGSTTARADVGIAYDDGSGEVDIAQRYMASTGGDIPDTDTGIAVETSPGVDTDIRHFFRRLGYVEYVPVGAYVSLFSNGTSFYTGDTATFTAYAGGDGTISVSWTRNGVPVSGTTEPFGDGVRSIYEFTVADGDSGTIEVTASNAYGSDSKDITISVNPAVSTTLTGDDALGHVESSGSWNFTAHAVNGLLRVRFQIEGHGSGDWESVSGTDYSSSYTKDYGSPIGSPPITNPGTYTFYFEAEDVNHVTSRSDLYVLISS